jgi:hypothetical protein
MPAWEFWTTKSSLHPPNAIVAAPGVPSYTASIASRPTATRLTYCVSAPVVYEYQTVFPPGAGATPRQMNGGSAGSTVAVSMSSTVS